MERRSLARAIFFAGVWIGLCLRFSQYEWFAPPTGDIWGVTDDAYVTADYARTVAMGEGPLWYPGAPRVEGFSSPLWVVLFAIFHRLPGFTEARLGAYVFALNAMLFAAIAACIAVMLTPAVERTGGRHRRAVVWAVLLALPLPAIALTRWCGGGFEVGLVALLSVLAFKEALRDEGTIRERRIAILMGLAFWARMDSVLTCAPAFALLLWKVRAPRRYLTFCACFLPMVAALFLARRWYYGDWMPNTYYLKITGWPLAKRIAIGFFQNYLTFSYFGLGGVGFVILAWRTLAPADRPLLFGLLAPILTLLYSTQNGGDFAWVAFGFDRHDAPSLPILVFTMAAILLCARGGTRELTILGVFAAVLAYGPVFTEGEVYTVRASDKFKETFDFRRRLARDMFQEIMVFDGQVLEEVTRPKARIAVCAAGATIYFARRGGVDILGKNDAYISHLPAAEKPGKDSRCFRPLAPSGHNKEDVPGLFALRLPEVSVMLPPTNVGAQYVSFTYKGRLFYGLKRSSRILWKKVTDVHAL